MAINSFLWGDRALGFVESKNNGLNGTGLKVYTYEGQERRPQTKFFLNETYGADMNINAAFGGTPDGIHNGTDTALWTASILNGSWTFDSTVQFHTGAMSVDGRSANNNHEALFTRGSTIDQTDYTAISGWIYIDNWSTGGSLKDIEFKLRNGGVDVTDILNLSGYVDTTHFDEWQKFVIPLADFTFSDNDLDEMSVKNRDQGGGGAPNFFLDDMQFEQVGGAVEFTTSPLVDEIWNLDTFAITMMDTYVANESNNGMSGISPYGFLGVSTLTSGIQLVISEDGVTTFNAILTDFIDLLTTPVPSNLVEGCDGTNTWFQLQFKFARPLKLTGVNNDKISFIISDDLSGLDRFMASINIGNYIIT